MKRILFLLLLGAGSAQADMKDCTHILSHKDNMQVSRDYWPAENLCFVSIHPLDTKEQVYRGYFLTSNGMLMVFNSFGPGPASFDTGAREFYFFPRVFDNLEVYYDQNKKEISVVMSPTLTVVFDTETAQIKSISNGQVKVDPNISKLNKGGVEITSQGHLMLDLGFTIGKSPSEVRKAKVKFFDKTSQSCTFLNQEIFVYKDGDALIDKTDQDIKSQILNRCPKMQL